MLNKALDFGISDFPRSPKDIIPYFEIAIQYMTDSWKGLLWETIANKILRTTNAKLLLPKQVKKEKIKFIKWFLGEMYFT